MLCRDRQKHSPVVPSAMVRVSVTALAAVLKECFSAVGFVRNPLPIVIWNSYRIEKDKKKMRGQGERQTVREKGHGGGEGSGREAGGGEWGSGEEREGAKEAEQKPTSSPAPPPICTLSYIIVPP